MLRALCMYPRSLEIKVTVVFGVISKCLIQVDHQIVSDQEQLDHAVGQSWVGTIPSRRTPIRIEASGAVESDGCRYSVCIAINGMVVTDIDRQLQSGSDVFQTTL